MKETRNQTMSTLITSPVPPAEQEKDSLLVKIVSFQADFITSFLISLFSPFFSLVSESFHLAEESKESVEKTVVAATRVPSKVAEGGVLFLRKIGYGCLGAFYACIILIAVLILSVILGVGLVRLWVDEPVLVSESVHFDYTEIHPTAVFPFTSTGLQVGKKKWPVPGGHTYYVSLVLLMPDSDYNRHIGVFQVTAEIISTRGNTLATSSQPCILQFRSLPVRLMHTFIMGVPLLLGISGETQTISITILKHKEGNPRTRVIRVKLQPRAGTSGVPQVYSSEIVIKSELPYMKQFAHNWKWTFYVWTSLYMYIMFLVVVVCCCRPLFFPMRVGFFNQRNQFVEEVAEQENRFRGNREALESLERWRRSRNRHRSKRKASFHQETGGSSASSSVVITRGEASEDVEDFSGFTDAESVCQGG
ncbi:hypothetical protein IFM89_008033 [Coptis chinensis]|uniref:Seipin n=1 Tax=Coptis chinensis TaxID=261450 RepID=A0A835HSI7_9MAGN|nr:hypothetical protein IFM89_008033 [Coptis chinensis]